MSTQKIVAVDLNPCMVCWRLLILFIEFVFQFAGLHWFATFGVIRWKSSHYTEVI